MEHNPENYTPSQMSYDEAMATINRLQLKNQKLQLMIESLKKQMLDENMVKHNRLKNRLANLSKYEPMEKDAYLEYLQNELSTCVKRKDFINRRFLEFYKLLGGIK